MFIFFCLVGLIACTYADSEVPRCTSQFMPSIIFGFSIWVRLNWDVGSRYIIPVRWKTRKDFGNTDANLCCALYFLRNSRLILLRLATLTKTDQESINFFLNIEPHNITFYINELLYIYQVTLKNKAKKKLCRVFVSSWFSSLYQVIWSSIAYLMRWLYQWCRHL